LLAGAAGAGASACGGAVDMPTSENASSDAAVTVDAAAPSACRQCQSDSCASQVAACNADPSCARYLTCESACPSDSLGRIDPTCAATCPPPEDASASVGALEALQGCRAEARCTACNEAYDAGYVDALSCQPSGDADCDFCTASRCCEGHLACRITNGCAPMIECVAGCSQAGGATYDCFVQCSAQFPDAATPYVALFGCRLARCGGQTQCGGSTGFDVACSACLSQNCGKVIDGCLLDVDCTLLDTCIGDCAVTDPACITKCEQTYPQSVTKRNSYFNCLTTRCGQLCQ
jgi:hypothetical protein